MYFLKKLISRFFFPVPLCAELLVIGLVLLFFTKRKKLGKGLLVLGTVLYLAISFAWLPAGALAPLERTFHTATDPVSLLQNLGATNVLIAVLGQSVSSDTSLPANVRFNQEFISRLLEAGRLHQLLPDSKIMVSLSGKTITEEGKLKVLAEFYAMMGIASKHIVLYGDAIDSQGEIRFFKSQAGTNQVFLVSSGSHLPRAMLLARRYGLNATPAPCLYLVDKSKDTESPFDPSGLFPGANNINLTERATYEYLGLLFEKLKPDEKQAGNGN